MRRRRRFGAGSPMDSLSGILPNILGVFALFVACLVLFGSIRAAVPAGNRASPPRVDGTPFNLKVHWPKPNTKTSVLASLQGGRVLLLDLDPVYRQLLKAPFPRRPRPIDVEQPGVSVRFYPLTNEAYCLKFHVHEDAGETLQIATRQGSAWQQARQRFPKERFNLFFWVSPDSFETFRTLRDSLRREGVDVDWKPVEPDGPVEVCQGVEGFRGMEPQ